MKRYKNVIIWVAVADLLLLVVLLALCIIADKHKLIKGFDGSEDSIVREIDRTSLTMDDQAGADMSKQGEFGSDIYDRLVVPSGEAMGIYMKTDGVMVVDVCSYKNEEGVSCCPVKDILQTGDYIISIDGTPISKRSEMLSVVAGSEGADMEIEYIRDGETNSAIVTPQKNENGNYLLGAWVKDDVSGIGTITFIDGTSFMALGHSVSDVDTGLMMRCSTGGVYTTSITNISKSYSEQPGRLQGNIAYRRALVGIIDGNSASGIYGHLDKNYCDAKYSDAEHMYIARGSETQMDTAYIYSRMSGELRKYEIEIEEIDSVSDDKNIEFHVTDEELLDLTGGVVQGMSGSPIIQNGKIIGAVTHVFVDDPTRGYGIFIENMLEE